MAKYLEELKATRPELRAYCAHFGDDLAEMWVKNLRGRQYKPRAEEGLRVALETPAAQLASVISCLIEDRESKGIPLEGKVATDEVAQRAMIMALWMNRRAYQKDGVWRAGHEQIYGDANYMPPVGINTPAETLTSPSPSISLNSDVPYTPSCEDVNTAYRRRCDYGDEVDIEMRLDWVEADLKAAGRRLAPGWRDVVREHCF